MSQVQSILAEAGLDKSHWGKRILAANRADEFTRADVADAGSWVTCACGKLSDGVQRNPTGSPRDGVLMLLGQRFSEAVNDDEFVTTAECLVRIEARAVIVLSRNIKL